MTTTACVEADPGDFAIEESLVELGWIKLAPSDLDEKNFRALAALMIVNQLGFGNAPAIRWQSTWERSLATAAGNARKVIVAGAPTQTAWFDREQSSALLRVEFSNYPALQLTQCQIAVTADIAENSYLPVVQTQLTPEMPPIVRPRDQRFERIGSTQVVQLHFFQTAAIQGLISDDFEFIGQLNVLNSSN